MEWWDSVTKRDLAEQMDEGRRKESSRMGEFRLLPVPERSSTVGRMLTVGVGDDVRSDGSAHGPGFILFEYDQSGRSTVLTGHTVLTILTVLTVRSKSSTVSSIHRQAIQEGHTCRTYVQDWRLALLSCPRSPYPAGVIG